MKTSFKILAILSLCLCCVTKPTFAQETEKTIKRSFPASAGHTLDVESKYSNIRVKVWNKNEIDFEIKISVDKKNKKDAAEILDKIDVKFQQSGKTVSAKTVFEKNFQCNDCRLSIEYNIMVPDGLNYIIDNKYGNVNLPDIKGNSQLTVKYGNLNAGNFYGNTNTFDIKYGNMDIDMITKGINNIDVKYGNMKSKGITDGINNVVDIKYGDLRMDKISGKTNMNLEYNGYVNLKETGDITVSIKYSKMSIEYGRNLEIDSKYSKIGIGKISGLRLISKHDDYDFGEIDNLNAECSYTDLTIDRLVKSLNVTGIQHGKIEVDHVSAGFDFIKADASYTDIVLTFDPDSSYDFKAYTKYGKIKTPTSNINTNNEGMQITGNVGGSSKSKIDIKNNYGDIILK